LSEALTRNTKGKLDPRFVLIVRSMYKQVVKNVTVIENFKDLKDLMENSLKEVGKAFENSTKTLITLKNCSKIIDSLEEILQKTLEIDKIQGKEHRLLYRTIKYDYNCF
jgi:hypothetical protein